MPTYEEIRLAAPAMTESFVANDMALLNAQLAALVAPRDIRIALDAEQTPALAAPLWQVEANGRTTFYFHPDVLGPYPAFVFGRWVDFLPVTLAALDRLEGAGQCFLNLGDEGHVPGIAFCDHRPDYTLVPDCIFLMLHGYSQLVEMFAANEVPWAERRSVLFWRGTTTGYRTHGGDAFSLPRVKLCERAAAMGERADVGISGYTQVSPDEEAMLRASGITRDFVDAAHFNRYQFHLDIDGNTNSWPGLVTKLHSGSPVLKVQSPGGFRQWFYDRLLPWDNYVPVQSDLSDLETVVASLLAEPDRAREIGERGRALALSMTMAAEVEYGAAAATALLRKRPA